METNKGVSTKKWAIIAAGLGLVYVLVKHRLNLLGTIRRAWHLNNTMYCKHIEIVNSCEDSQRIVRELKKHCQSVKVLGFDCEWITVGGTRRPVALMQLSSHKGLCALFRLCLMKQIPKELRELLEDDSVLKVGVAPQEDARKLSHDYGVGVASTFDLRFMAVMAGHEAEGLGKLSKKHLNFFLEKNWRLSCSNWENKVLQRAQLNYAAYDALAAVAIYQKLSKDLEPRSFWHLGTPNYDEIRQKIEPFLDLDYSKAYTCRLAPQESSNTAPASSTPNRKTKTKKMQLKKEHCRQFGTQSKAFYDNCLLQAPDGELLCTIDRQKAAWYLTQELGTKISETPLTVRLHFEPAGRAVGEVGRYYQTPKENRCVVCGRRDAYIRKNVVPHEYRRHFPVVMKSHTSHDVLLLCPGCHQASNISDFKVRLKLAEKCNAPVKPTAEKSKYIEDQKLKRVKSAANALLYHGRSIPAARAADMTETLLQHYKHETVVTQELLQKAADIDYKIKNEQYCEHGETVVRTYCEKHGGIIELEKLWREHFLLTMKPKFLPEYWNVNHNADRLEVRAHEGRVEAADLRLAGLESVANSMPSA